MVLLLFSPPFYLLAQVCHNCYTGYSIQFCMFNLKYLCFGGQGLPIPQSAHPVLRGHTVVQEPISARSALKDPMHPEELLPARHVIMSQNMPPKAQQSV